MLDALESFLVGKLHILAGDVVLQIDPGAFAGFHRPESGDFRLLVRGGRNLAAGGETKIAKHGRHRLLRAAQHRPKAQVAVGRARDRHADRQGLARHEGGDIVAPDRTAALMAGQVDVRVPAAGNRQTVGLDRAPAGVV